MTNASEIEKDAVFAEEDFVVEAQTFLHSLMEEKGVSRSELARAMGVSRARVSQIFSDECKNFTVRLLARATHALGEAPIVTRRSSDASKQQSKRDWALALLDPDALAKFWQAKEQLGEVKRLVPCNDEAPRRLTGYDLSRLSWKAA